MSLENYTREFLERLVLLADGIREAQRNYMENRGDDSYGKKVADATAAYDKARQEENE